MSLFETIKLENIAALKSGDKVKRGIYTLLLGEIGRAGDPKAEVADATVISAANKIVAGINEMIAKGSTDERLPAELAILQALLPKNASEEDLIDFVSEYVTSHSGLTMKDMGSVMAAAKEHFNGAIDGKLASTVVRNVLSSIK